MAGIQAIKHLQKRDDLVGAVAFLTPDDTAFITAQTYAVNGGTVHV